jgi:hypothetical protein
MSIDEALSVFELNKNATKDDIRRAFHKMAKKYHPDLFRNFTQQAWATERFIKIKSAYDLLMSANVFGEGVSSQAEYYQEEKEEKDFNEGLNASFSLFDWVLNKVDEDNPLVYFIVTLIFTPMFFAWAPYVAVSSVLERICRKIGVEPSPKITKSHLERSVYLGIWTLPALIYLPIFYWIVFTGEFSQTILRIVIGILPLLVILSLLSEWIGFFLTTIHKWRNTLSHAMDTKKYSTNSNQKLKTEFEK